MHFLFALESATRSLIISSVEHAESLVDEVDSSVICNVQVLIALSRSMQSDDYTYMHSVEVCLMMMALARQLGMEDYQVRLCGTAGLLHEIGKITIDLICLISQRLDGQKFTRIKTHPQAGWLSF